MYVIRIVGVIQQEEIVEYDQFLFFQLGECLFVIVGGEGYVVVLFKVWQFVQEICGFYISKSERLVFYYQVIICLVFGWVGYIIFYVVRIIFDIFMGLQDCQRIFGSQNLQMFRNVIFYLVLMFLCVGCYLFLFLVIFR